MHSVNLLECNVKQIANVQGSYEFSESELADFVRQETVTVLEQLFNQWDQQWQHWPNASATIDELTIDLPKPINRRHPERFQQQLLEALSTGILKALPGPLQQQWRLTQLLTHFESSLRYRQADYARRDWQLMAELFTQLTSSDRRPILTSLLRLIQSAQTRAFIAQQFSDSQLAILFDVLSPEQAKFIMSVIQHAEQFALVDDEQPRTEEAALVIQAPNQAVTKKQIAEFSLAFISVQRGSRFNRTRYLRHVLQSIAAHYNTSFEELCEILHRAAEQAPQNRPWRQELLEITAPEFHPAESFSKAQNTRQRDLARYEKILSALQQSQTIDAESWSAFFQLTERDSSVLTGLLRHVLLNRAWLRHFRKTLPSSLRPRIVSHLQWLFPEVVLGSEKRRFKEILRFYSQAANTFWDEDKTEQAFAEQHQVSNSLAFLMAQQPDVLRERLLAQTIPDRIIQALITALLPSQLLTLVDILNPRVGAFWQRYASVLKQGLYSFAFVQPQAVDRAYWYTALQFAWNVSQGRQSLTLANMLVSLVRRLRLESVSVFQLNEPDILLQLQRGLAQEEPVSEELRMAIEYVVASEVLTPAIPDQIARAWLLIVERSLRDQKTLALSSLPDISHVDFQQYVQPVLLAWLREASVRERFLALPEKIQQRLLIPLLPKRSESIRVLWQADFTKITKATSDTEEVVPHEKAQYEVRLFCLIYLANERGSQFNQHSFGRTLVRQLSAHFNIQAEVFLLQLQRALPADKSTQQMFSWLWSDTSVKQHSQPVANDAKVNTADNDWLALQQLNDLMRTPVQQPLSRWRTSLEALSDSQPLCLLQWFRLLQSDPEQLKPLLLHADGDRILNLILAALMKVTGHTNRADGQALLSAIEHHANKSEQTTVFYWLTIQALLTGKVLDMEALRLKASDKQNVSTVNVRQLTSLPERIKAQEETSAQVLLEDRQAFIRFLQQPVDAQWRWFKQYTTRTTTMLWPTFMTLQQLVERLDGQRNQSQRHEDMIRLLLQAEVNNTAVDLLIQRWLASACSLSQVSDLPQWLTQLLQRLSDDIALFTMLSPGKQSPVLSFLKTMLTTLTKWDLKTDAQLTSVFTEVTQVDSGRIIPMTKQEASNTIHALTEPESTSQPDTTETVSTQDSDQEQWHFASFGGLVILAPYFPSLFSQFNLLKDGVIADEASTELAVQLLHYLCVGDAEYFQQNAHLASLINVILNRPLNHALSPIELSDEQKKLCDSLLHAVIQHWSALGKTSMEGLRETFLQRDAYVRLDSEKGWMIRIERRPFDVLLERLPWNFRTIKHPFMHYCLNVEW